MTKLTPALVQYLHHVHSTGRTDGKWNVARKASSDGLVVHDGSRFVLSLLGRRMLAFVDAPHVNKTA